MEETLGIIHDVIKLFEENEDAQAIARIRALNQEIQLETEKAQASMKDVIRTMTADVERLEEETKHMRTPQEYVAKFGVVQQKEQRVLRDINTMEAEKQSMEQKIAKLQEKEIEFASYESKLKQQQAAQAPRIASMLSLYANVSRIKWDYDADTVKGFILVPEDSDVRPFNIDQTKHSRAFIANYLWDLMATAPTPSS